MPSIKVGDGELQGRNIAMVSSACPGQLPMCLPATTSPKEGSWTQIEPFHQLVSPYSYNRRTPFFRRTLFSSGQKALPFQERTTRTATHAYVANQQPRAWNSGFTPRWTPHRFRHPQDRDFHYLEVSAPINKTFDELLETRKENRWIITTSFDRFVLGRRQALLDRFSTLQDHLADPAVGKR